MTLNTDEFGFLRTTNRMDHWVDSSITNLVSTIYEEIEFT